MNTGNTGFYNPNTGQLYYCHSNACFYQLNQQPFHPWEVALAVVAAVVLVATAVLFVRRLRAS
jgi:hypothetical protein